jgi:Calcium binding
MARSVAPKIDPVREHRIDYEIIVDAYNEYEAAIGWLTYLQEHLNFPFEATYHPEDEEARQVTVQDLENDEEALDQGFIEFNIEIDDDGECWVALEEITPLESNPEAVQAVEDWRYWLARGRG